MKMFFYKKESEKNPGQIDKIKRIFAIGFIILLGAFLIYSLFPFVTAIFGALIFFVLFRPFYKFLNEKAGLRKGLSAGVVIFVSLIILIIPFVIIINALITETRVIIENKMFFGTLINLVDNLFPNSDFGLILSDFYPDILNFSKNFIINISQSAGRFIINLFIMYFVLYFLFVDDKIIKEKVCEFIPFNNKNSKELLLEFKNITYSTVLATGIIAVLQGSFLTIAFLIFGVKGALLWGLIGTILSFFPFFGTPMIWIPAVIIRYFQHDYRAAIGLLISGIFISTFDNLLRPYIQKKVGSIHPVISVVGIFMGIPIFGLLGVVIGPLLLSYFLLSVRMFREEYY